MEWGKILSIDYRSLRLFRFGLGLFILVDLALRLQHFEAFMTESGVHPMHLVKRSSLYALSHSPAWAGFLFLVTAAVGVGLICNYRPRLLSLSAFILIMSLRNRNQLLMYGADDLFRLGLLWSTLLPSGPSREGEKSFSSLASLGALGQIFALYFSAGMSKEFRVWVQDPIATFVALSSDTYAKPLTHLVLPYPKLLGWATISVFFIERAGWLLFFSPWRNADLRMAGVAIFALMHLSFGLFLHLELFPMIDIVFLTLLLPEKFWDYLQVKDTFRVVRPVRAEPLFAGAAVALLSIVLYVNICSIPQIGALPWQPVRRFAKSLGIYQAWSMFTPVPGLSDGYYRVISRSPAGEMADEFNKKLIPSWPVKPVDPQAEMGGFRWTRYFEEANAGGDEKIRKELLRYFCRRWKPNTPGAEAREISLYHFRETTLAPELPIVSKMNTIVSASCKD